MQVARKVSKTWYQIYLKQLNEIKDSTGIKGINERLYVAWRLWRHSGLFSDVFDLSQISLLIWFGGSSFFWIDLYSA
ncbi:hypothetical protein CEW82_11915 [Lactiplantibacillus pentosus]|nr:hypothetical protein CEW82_11915 [Lactiplantibacillus pentosus]